MARNDFARSKVKWKGPETVANAYKKMEINARAAGMMLEGAVVRKLSVGQPAKRSGSRLIGLNPSRPGEPPRLLHGLLRNSIYHRTLKSKRSIAIAIGANTPYARALEKGNPRATSRAHGSSRKNVRGLASAMRSAGAGKPRPYLRPALRENREKALRMLLRGTFR